MKNPEQNSPPEADRQPLNVFSAGLSLICPGLGQLAQKRYDRALWLLFLWQLIIVDAFLLFGYLFAGMELELQMFLPMSPADFPLLLIIFGPLLLAVPFILLSVLDAAMWSHEKPMIFKKQFLLLTILLVPLITFHIFVAPAATQAQDAARRMQCSGQTKQLTLAFHTYHDDHGSFPPAYTVDENGKPLHSWRVLILPYIEQRELYDKIRLDEPWDSEYNRQFHDVQLRNYQCPSSSRQSRTALRVRNIFLKNPDLLRTANCDYSVVIGEDTLFPGSETVTFNDITTGTRNTILLVERMVPIHWMDPNNEIRFDVARIGVNKHPLGIGSEHGDGAYVSCADGSVRYLQQTADGRIQGSTKTIYESITPFLTKSSGDEW